MRRFFSKQTFWALIPVISLLGAVPLNALAETNLEKVQNQALQALDKNGQAKEDLQKVFDHYDRISTESAVPKQANPVVKNGAKPQKNTPINVPKEATRVSSISRPTAVPTRLASLPKDAYPEDRDPFALTNRLIRQDTSPKQKNVNTEQDRAYSFTRLKTGVKVPKLTLRGLILKSKKEKAAVLEVEGMGTYVVREGDTISIPDGGFNNVIKVTQIDRLSLLIEVGKLGEVIIVR